MRRTHGFTASRALLAFFLVLACAGCAGPGYYLRNRGMDLADIVTAGVEKNVYGVNITAGPLTVGLNETSHGYGAGLRAGTVGFYSTGDTASSFREPDGRSFILLNSVSHQPTSLCRGGSDSKAFKYRNALVIRMYDISGYNSFFQFEIAVALYGGLRIGINLAEGFDFLMGIAGLDFLGDDTWCEDELE